MRKLLNFFIVAFCTAGLFVVASIAMPRKAHAAPATKQYQGILEKHTNPKYTHKLKDQNVNLIMSASYDKWLGEEVEIDVVFNSDGTFKVTSVTLVGVTTPAPTRASTVIYTGVLKSASAPYTHKLKDGDVNVNLILYPVSDYVDLVGKTVEVEVEFMDGGKFWVISIGEVIV